MENKPIKRFKAGTLEGVVWLNKKEIEGKQIEFKTVTISRSYKKSDIWMKEHINLRKNDIQKAIIILTNLQNELFLTKEE